MKTLQLLPLHPSGFADVFTGWAHLLRLWQKILIEMIKATVDEWGRGDGFDLLILEGYQDKTRGLNVKREALNQWITSLDHLPSFPEFLAWIRGQEGNLLDDVTERGKWNAFAGGYEFDAPTIAGIEAEFSLNLTGITHAAAINPLIDATKFHELAARHFLKPAATPQLREELGAENTTVTAKPGDADQLPAGPAGDPGTAEQGYAPTEPQPASRGEGTLQAA